MRPTFTSPMTTEDVITFLSAAPRCDIHWQITHLCSYRFPSTATISSWATVVQTTGPLLFGRCVCSLHAFPINFWMGTASRPQRFTVLFPDYRQRLSTTLGAHQKLDWFSLSLPWVVIRSEFHFNDFTATQVYNFLIVIVLKPSSNTTNLRPAFRPILCLGFETTAACSVL